MEDVEVLSPEQVEMQLTHDEEVKELFEKVTANIPGTTMRAISLEGFTIAIDQMMNKAFYYGAQHSMGTVQDIMDRVFNPAK